MKPSSSPYLSPDRFQKQGHLRRWMLKAGIGYNVALWTRAGVRISFWPLPVWPVRERILSEETGYRNSMGTGPISFGRSKPREWKGFFVTK